MSERPAAAFRAVLWKEILHSWRDRSVLVLVFAVPLLLAGITSVAFGRLADAGAVTIGVVDHDGGTAAQTLVYQILPGLKVGGGALVDTKLFMNDAAVQRATRKGTLSAAIVIPGGFGTGIRAGKPPALRLFTGGDTSLGVPVADAVLRGFSAQVGTVGLAVQTVTTGPGARPQTQTVTMAAAKLRAPVTIEVEQAGPLTLKPAGYFAPSMLVLALFFCGQIAARGLVAERSRRTLARLVQSAVPMWRVLLAKYAVALAVGVLAAAVLLGVFTAFGTSFGQPAALAVLVVAAAGAMIAVSSLVVLVVRTEQQAGSVGTTMAFVLAILGGNFVPPSRTSPVLEDIARWTPNGWATRAFADLSVARDGAWATIAPALLVLACFTVLAGAVVVALSRRMVRRAHA